MLHILKEQFEIGDTIKVTLTNSREVTGKIRELSDSYLILESLNGKLVTLLDKMIGMWEEVDSQEIEETTTNVSENKEGEEKFDNSAINLRQESDINEKESGESLIDDNEDSKTTNEVTRKGNIGLKVVGKIDLAKLEKEKRREEIKKAKAAHKAAQKEKEKQSANSLKGLVQILKPELEKANEQTVPANGILYRFFGDRFFGFIRDKFDYELYFNYRDVIDKNLLNSLVGSASKASIPVLFTLQKMGDKERAIFVQKPKKIKEILTEVEDYMSSKKYDSAMALLGQVLEAFPDNFSANQLKGKIEKNRFKPKFPKKKKSYAYDLNYRNAKKAKDNKDYNKAIELFLKALENKEKVESTIKDLAQTYLEIGEIEKGVELIEKNIDELPETMTTFNFLDHYYTSAKNFNKAIEYLDRNLDLVNFSDKKTYSRLLTKKAFCLIQLKDFEEAQEFLEEAIEIQPDNTYASNLLNALESASTSGDYEEVDTIIEETEFISFSSGISPYLNRKLSDGDYFGLKAAVIESGKFEKKHLFELRDLMREAGRARPRERASYLMTEAKLLLEIFPDKESDLRSVLARYCNAMALAYIYEKEEKLDLIRYYYLEAFGFEENWDSLVRQVVVYLNTYLVNHKELIEINAKERSSLEGSFLDSTIEKIISGRSKNKWEGLINAFLSSRIITTELLKRIYKKSNTRNLGINYLKEEGLFKDNDSYPDVGLFIESWNKIIQKRQRELNRWFAIVKSISNHETIEAITNQLQTTLNSSKQPWITQLDVFRINIISDDIHDLLTRYVKVTTYDDKERTFNQIKAEINQLINEIEEQPTKLSYEGLKPLLDKLMLALKKSFEKVTEASTPRLSMRILGNNNVIGEGNMVPFKVIFSNDKQCSPISRLTISVEENENIKFPSNETILEESLKGGDEKIVELAIKVSKKVITEKATTVKLNSEYQIRGKEEVENKTEDLALRLYSEDDFVKIPNPFAPLADGGPVEDNTMFYGRGEFINNITKAILSAESKQIIIYGQKRSGKSSVLYHLKEELEKDTNKAFCVNFSLGDIVEDLNTSTFYHKILSLIEETLEDLEFEGIKVPEYKAPTLAAFEQNVAADLFRKSLKNFKRSCSKTSGWEDKKLVVMIDEFTYLYTAILRKQVSDNIMQQWKAVTQNKDSRFSVVLVGQDVVPKFKSLYPNPFGVIEDKRLTYLHPSDAKDLIEKPIWNKVSDQSRFLGSAVDKILDYTSCNPFYIQIFCARLVDYLNKKKINEVTEVEVRLIADSFINGEQSLTADKFDNLLTAGDADLEAIPLEDTIQVLKQIADNSRNIPMCARENISLKDEEYDNLILQDLIDREVIESPQSGYFKIKVKLFQEWLLKQ